MKPRLPTVANRLRRGSSRNRIDGRDVDLTVEQFDGHEDIVAIAVLTGDEIRARSPAMRPELARRIDVLRRSVATRLAAPATG